MDVNRHIKFLRSLEDGPEPFVIKKQSVRQAVHHCALESELCDTTFEFVRGCLWIGCRQAAESRKPVRMRANDFLQTIVCAAREPRNDIRFSALRCRRAM